MPTLKRRTIKTIKEFLTPEQIYELITSKTMIYHSTQEYYHTRDRALMAISLLSAGRINEVLSLTKSNFDVKESPHYIVVNDMPISKRKQETIEKYGPHVARRWPFFLPLSEDPKIYEHTQLVRLAPFSKLVVKHLEQTEEDQKLFMFGTRWAYEIIRQVTGEFPNWFRAQGEMIYGSIIRDSIKLAKFVGVVRPEQVAHYIGFDYRDMLRQPQIIR